MSLNRILFIGLLASSVTSCQILAVSIPESTGMRQKADLFERIDELVPGSRLIIYEHVSQASAEIKLAEKDSRAHCGKFSPPTAYAPPRLPEFEPWELEDADAINRKLISHIESLQKYMTDYNLKLDESFKEYVESCPDLNIKTDSADL